MRSNWPIPALLAALVGALAAPAPAADAKKEAPKKPAKIKEADPARVTDPDFKIQGEYDGSAGTRTLGAQVVALGNGAFDVRVLAGGLPGAGWDGKTQQRASAKTVDGKVVIQGKEVEGSIAGGVLTLNDAGGSTFSLKRVERKSKTLGEKPPEGAVVLYGGPADASKWQGGNTVKLSDGEFLGVGVKTKQAFKDFKLHLEFRLAYQPNDRGQGRSNSGLYLQDRYEVQILDSFGLKGVNNECGGVYTQFDPAVNMCLPPLVWQTYDIEFTAAEFDADGKRTKPARATVYHNGVKIHDNIAFPKECPGGQKESAKPGPFQLQNHGDPLVFRNIWVVENK